MKTTALTIALVLFMSTDVQIKESNSVATDPSHDAEIDALLSRMSVEEKVGQMTQIDLNIILEGGYSNFDGTIDPDLLALAVNTYKVGSILNVTNQAYDLDTWHKLITQIQDAAMKNDNKIPVIYGVDAIHGASYVRNSTLFPHNLNYGATRNNDLAYKTAKVTAMETRASGVRWNFDPVLDLGRNPLWPRFEETFGEDPVIAGEMGTAAVIGYEEDGLNSVTSVASSIKHFLGYSTPRSGRDRTPAHIPEVQLREYDLAPYYDAIKAGASSLMVNSGEVNGVPVHGNRYILTDILRGELGFEGVIVSDWEDVNRLHERHNVAATMKEGVRMAVMAGIDMSMTPHDFRFAELLKELYVEDAEVAAQVDASVRRILKLKFDVGLFDDAYPEPDAAMNFGRPEFKELALQVAHESITLAKNENATLPLKGPERVLLAGPCQDNKPSMHGSWSYVWQGNNPDLYPESTQTVKDALVARLGAERVIALGSNQYNDASNYDVDALISASSQVDHIVLCLGEDAYAESPGSIQDLNLDARQVALAKAAIHTGKPVTVVMFFGRPRLINAFAEDVDAMLLAYRPGSMGAQAVVDILYGDVNPSGRLPFTYPRQSGDIVLYDHKWTELNVENEVGQFTNHGYDPQYEFGHGLSYTTFEYSDFKADREVMSPDDTVNLEVTLTNSGDRSGVEVVELYSRQMYASVVPSMRRLRKYQRVELEPGESKTVQFEISKEDIDYVKYGDAPGTFQWGVEDGEIRFMIAGFGFEVQKHESGKSFISMPYEHSIAVQFKN